MLTPEQLRALVMASLAGPHLTRISAPIHDWTATKRLEYFTSLRASADLIIAAAESPAARTAPAFETDANGDRGVLVTPPARAHRLDQPAASVAP